MYHCTYCSPLPRMPIAEFAIAKTKRVSRALTSPAVLFQSTVKVRRVLQFPVFAYAGSLKNLKDLTHILTSSKRNHVFSPKNNIVCARALRCSLCFQTLHPEIVNTNPTQRLTLTVKSRSWGLSTPISLAPRTLIVFVDDLALRAPMPSFGGYKIVRLQLGSLRAEPQL